MLRSGLLQAALGSNVLSPAVYEGKKTVLVVTPTYWWNTTRLWQPKINLKFTVRHTQIRIRQTSPRPICLSCQHTSPSVRLTASYYQQRKNASLIGLQLIRYPIGSRLTQEELSVILAASSPEKLNLTRRKISLKHNSFSKTTEFHLFQCQRRRTKSHLLAQPIGKIKNLYPTWNLMNFLPSIPWRRQKKTQNQDQPQNWSNPRV